MTHYDLCIAWNWEYDKNFIEILEHICHQEQVSLLQITPQNLNQWLPQIYDGRVRFRSFFDRASEDDARFLPLVRRVVEWKIPFINHHDRAVRAADKAAMHSDFIHTGLYAPYTIILPSYNQQPQIAEADLTPLGGLFTIKPAHGSGGEGVLNKATTWQQVMTARKEHPTDRYLLQQYIAPRNINSHPAWFRVIYCTGSVYPCWWHPHTHLYQTVSEADRDEFNLQPLTYAAETIARICGLDLFSTEIAFTSGDLFVVVDYVNDPIDLRIQSNTQDGVPDAVVRDIVHRLVTLVRSNT